eukprot:gene13666-29056_t
MIANSLQQALSITRSKLSITALILNSSADLKCTNMFCEKVTLPCLCRLESVLQKLDSSELVKLDLGNNGLTDLPPSISSLTSLQELYLSDNNLTTLPDTFSKLHELRVLDMRGNKVKILPESVKSLPKLKDIKM